MLNLHQLKRDKYIYFIGAGGSFLSGLAILMKKFGFPVKGSDINKSNYTDALEEAGIKVCYGHAVENITDNIQLIVYSTGVPISNEELIEGKRLGIQIVDRSELLGSIMNLYSKRIVVSGTNGKSTTTSMIGNIMSQDGVNPTVIIGGINSSNERNIQIGGHQYFVSEGCEYFDGFLKLHPSMGLVTNIEAEHLDYFKDINQILSSFLQFSQNINESGYLIVCNDDKGHQHNRQFIQMLNRSAVTYGIENTSDFSAKSISWNKGFPSYDLYYNEQLLTRITLGVPGEHNIYNSLAAAAACYLNGADIESIRRGLLGFSGVKRRLEYKGECSRFVVYDDQGSHPAEIKATVSALKKMSNNKPIIVIFKPVSYVRTRDFLEEYRNCFDPNDFILITDIKALRDRDLTIIRTIDLVKNLRNYQLKVRYVKDFSEIRACLNDIIGEKLYLLTLGSKEVSAFGEEIMVNFK